MAISRRSFLAAAAAAPFAAHQAFAAPPAPAPRADAAIFVWLPGGLPQTDTWDPKRHTPFEPGMRGDELLTTCPAAPTAIDGLHFGVGLERIGAVMDRGAVVRGIGTSMRFGAVHLKAQHYLLTGHPFPAGFAAPSIGSVVARVRGRRRPDVPAYIYLGRDRQSMNVEDQMVAAMAGAGFLGAEYAPVMIADARRGLEALAAPPSAELDRRLKLLERLAKARGSNAAYEEHLRSVAAARSLMDSPLRTALEIRRGERADSLAAYQPDIAGSETLEPEYFHGDEFAAGLLAARRLIEAGARFVQVEYPYRAFHSIDMHKNGGRSIAEIKRQIDRPIAQLVRDLEQRGLLDRTLVVVATEFGRTIAASEKAGTELEGFAEETNGRALRIDNQSQYGFHGHMSSASAALLFGGGVRRGTVRGNTADRHLMIPVEHATDIQDFRATILALLGIAPDTHHVVDGRPVFVTRDGKGKPVTDLMA